MPHNFLRETPAEFRERFERDVRVLRGQLIGQPHLENTDPDARQATEEFTNDYLRSDDEFTCVEQYVIDLYRLDPQKIHGIIQEARR